MEDIVPHAELWEDWKTKTTSKHKIPQTCRCGSAKFDSKSYSLCPLVVSTALVAMLVVVVAPVLVVMAVVVVVISVVVAAILPLVVPLVVPQYWRLPRAKLADPCGEKKKRRESKKMRE